MKIREMVVRPIGVVRNQFGAMIPHGWEHSISELQVEPIWAEALDGIDEFSHIVVLFWLDRIVGEPTTLRIRPKGRADTL